MFVYFGEDDYGNTIKKLPENSRYIKSEDILYEIKKIQQKQILSDGMEYDYVKRGMSLLEAKKFLASKEGCKQEEYIKFAQENILTERHQCNILRSIYNPMHYIY